MGNLIEFSNDRTTISDWKSRSDNIWKAVTEKEDSLKSPNAYQNAHALMSLCLGKDVDPTLQQNIIDFNKNKQSLKIDQNNKIIFSKINFVNIIISNLDDNKLIGTITFKSPQSIKNEKSKYSLNYSNNNYKIIEDNQQEVGTLEFSLENNPPFVKLTSSKFTLRYFIEQDDEKGFYTLGLKLLSKETTGKETETISATVKDIGKLVWQDIIKFKKEIQSRGEEKIGEEVNIEIIKESNKEKNRLIKVNLIEESILKQWWKRKKDGGGDGKKFLEYQLNRRWFDNNYIKKFLRVFYEEIIIKKDDTFYGIIDETYSQQMNGSLGEVETKVKILELSPKEPHVTSLNVDLTGQNKYKGKDIPADGVITFQYNGQQYKCSFQSKFYSLSSLKNRLYSNAAFYLGMNLTKEQYNTTLYSYSPDLIEDYPLNHYTNSKQYLDPQLYTGAVPGLLRINTFLENLEREFRTCDFYYISGIFIPSVYLLKQIKESVSESNSNKMIKVQRLSVSENSERVVRTKYNVVKGSLNIPITQKLIKNFTQFN